ncbi:hypothetical protein GWK47_006875 [Chionoecetes opilio]|uniref:Uncharacterized protein n=1 Tax=Chionoecetes opilio TaxID=41210 RepID=A0A8J4YF72_CHIOP|nr:hypothetical protein GWK47_006875 [Chionoecetes opilio]
MDARRVAVVVVQLVTTWLLKLQSDVHFRSALTHLQSPLHPFLQPHRSNSEQDTAASGNNVHNGSHPPEVFFFHPHNSGEEHLELICVPAPKHVRPGKWHVLRAAKALR